MEYRWIQERDDGRTHFGLIAQELLDVDPTLGMVCPQVTYRNKAALQSYGVHYTELVPVLIKAVQELTARVQQLESAQK